MENPTMIQLALQLAKQSGISNEDIVTIIIKLLQKKITSKVAKDHDAEYTLT